jgi:hypothetical protein
MTMFMTIDGSTVLVQGSAGLKHLRIVMVLRRRVACDALARLSFNIPTM